MCDCYGEPCKICGELIPMHLEDYNTTRREIVAVCGMCISTTSELSWLGLGPYRFTEYSYCTEEKTNGNIWKSVRIYALTANAWKFRDGNHPNASIVKKLGEHLTGFEYLENKLILESAEVNRLTSVVFDLQQDCIAAKKEGIQVATTWIISNAAWRHEPFREHIILNNTEKKLLESGILPPERNKIRVKEVQNVSSCLV